MSGTKPLIDIDPKPGVKKPLLYRTDNEILQESVETHQSPEKGIKYDKDKERWDLIQPLILEEYVKVLTHGARKYAPNNWRKVDNQRGRYFAALMRHLWAWWRGEKVDPESGLHHLAHAMCCVAFLAEPELEAMVDSKTP